MARIIVRRDGSLAGLTKEFLLFVDGESRASIARGESVDLTLAPGAHALEARMGDAKSPALKIVLGDRDEIRLLGGATGFFNTDVFLRVVSHVTIRDRFGAARATSSGARRNSRSRPSDPAPQWCKVLGVSADASAGEIRTAYLRLIKKYHPDAMFAFGADMREMAELRAREINVAYSAALRLHRKR